VATKRHPIYVVRRADYEGCGHQHQYPNQAHNCAINLLTRHKRLEWAEVVRIRRHATSIDIKQNTVERIDQWFGKDNATTSEIEN
jgi:hypothetical protein